MVRMGAAQDLLAHDPTAGTTFHRPDDRYIPILPCELTKALAADATRFGVTAEEVCAVAGALDDVLEQEAATFRRALTDFYAPFNPDRDTQPLAPPELLRSPESYRELLARLAYLLEKANYRRLTNVQVEAAVRQARAAGYHVRLRPERITELGVWVRGTGTVARRFRRWRLLLQWQHWRTWCEFLREGLPEEIPVYRRLAVVCRLRDDPHVLIKLFKDIPEADVEALLPHAEVHMNWRDRLLVLGGGAGALGSTAGKLLTIVTGAAAALWQLLWILLLGAGMLIFRTVLGYRRARSNRDSQRTRHLYFQNLGNNNGALQLLVSTVVHEEFKEALLGWLACQRGAGPPATAQEFDARLETYLRERFGVQVDFDAGDALETLTRFGLWAAGQPFTALPPAATVAALRSHWLGRCSAGYHAECLALRGAQPGSVTPDTAQPDLAEAALRLIPPPRPPAAPSPE